jgi:hypothetical protein
VAGDLSRAEELLGRPYTVTATTGDDGCLDVAMPVALPPAGSYRAVVECVGVYEPRPAMVNVDKDGSLRLDPSSPESRGTYIRVEFEDG